MTHFLKKLVAAWFILGSVAVGFAQQMPPIPTDANVRIGKLENGLTYYIRHNNLPEKELISTSLKKSVPFWKMTISAVWRTSWNICASTGQRTSQENINQLFGKYRCTFR